MIRVDVILTQIENKLKQKMSEELFDEALCLMYCYNLVAIEAEYDFRYFMHRSVANGGWVCSKLTCREYYDALQTM